MTITTRTMIASTETTITRLTRTIMAMDTVTVTGNAGTAMVTGTADTVTVTRRGMATVSLMALSQ